MIPSSSDFGPFLQDLSAQPQSLAEMTSVIGRPEVSNKPTSKNTRRSTYSAEERKQRNRQAQKEFQDRRKNYITELQTGIATHEQLITQTQTSSQQAFLQRNAEQWKYDQLQALCRDKLGSAYEFTDEDRRWIENEARNGHYLS